MREVRKRRYSEHEIGKARVAASRAEGEVKRINQRIARLERERDEAATTRTVAGVLDDGTLAELEVAGVALSAVVDTMSPQSRWRVQGAGRFAEGVLQVKLRTALPAGAEPDSEAGAGDSTPEQDEPKSQ